MDEQPSPKRKRFFENEMFENLVTYGCNPQWHELMENCQKNGSANDATNLIKTIELFLASEEISTNPTEYPVDFICKHGNLDMFKTFITLSGFDLDVNQPILTNKLTPYAADYNNVAIVTYLITKMEMEFRINLLEKCLVQRDKKLPKLLQPFLPLDYSRSIPEENDIYFFLKSGNRFMQEIFSPDSKFEVISSHIISFLDLRSLFVIRSVSKSFKLVIDQKFEHWKKIYLQEKSALLEKLSAIEKNLADFKSRVTADQLLQERIDGRLGGDSACIKFFAAEWRKIIENIEDLKKLEKMKMLIKRYHILNTTIRVLPIQEQNKIWFSWVTNQRSCLMSPIIFCVKNRDVEMMKLVLTTVDTKSHLEFIGNQIRPFPLIHMIVMSGQFEMVKLVSRFTPFVDLEARNNQGRNALHIAAQGGHLSILRFLLENAKFANPRDNAGFTPYKWATEEIKMYLESLHRARIIDWLN